MLYAAGLIFLTPTTPIKIAIAGIRSRCIITTCNICSISTTLSGFSFPEYDLVEDVRVPIVASASFVRQRSNYANISLSRAVADVRPRGDSVYPAFFVPPTSAAKDFRYLEKLPASYAL
jgi:hypothetical protein